MLTQIVETPENKANAERPAVMEAAIEVLNFYNIKQNLKLYYNGESETPREFGSQYDDPLRAGEQTSFINTSKVFIIAEKQPTEFNSGYGNSGRTETNPALWHNDKTRLTITPMFRGMKMRVELNAHINTRAQAVNFVNSLQLRLDRQSARPTFDAHIHYPVNNEIVLLAHHLWTLAVKFGEVIPPYPDDLPKSFVEWFMENSKVPMSIITNHANANPVFVFKRKLRQLTLMLEEPNIALTKASGAYLGKYEVSFAFTFYWQEHTGYKSVYPLMIMQQPVGSLFLPKKYKPDAVNRDVRHFIEREEINQIRNNGELDWLDTRRIPVYDGWEPSEAKDLNSVLQVNLVVENTEQQVLANLNGIPGVTWDPVIYDWLILYRNHLTYKGDTVLHFRVYSDDLMVKDDQIKIDDRGNIILTRPPTMANNYRLVVFIDMNLALLSDYGRKAIIEDQNYQLEVLPRVYPWWNWLAYTTWRPTPDEDGYLHIDDKPIRNPNDLDDILDNIGQLDYRRSGPKHQMDLSLFAHTNGVDL